MEIPKSASRRATVFGIASSVFLALPMAPAFALTEKDARKLVANVVREINTLLNSGKPVKQVAADLEQTLAKYADVPTIARGALGITWRSASATQRMKFSQEFQGYLARKYVRRFTNLSEARFEYIGSREIKKDRFEIVTLTKGPGSQRYEVRWHIWERQGKPRVFNIVIDGVNLLAVERSMVGNLLDRYNGNMDKLIAALARRTE